MERFVPAGLHIILPSANTAFSQASWTQSLDVMPCRQSFLLWRRRCAATCCASPSKASRSKWSRWWALHLRVLTRMVAFLPSACISRSHSPCCCPHRSSEPRPLEAEQTQHLTSGPQARQTMPIKMDEGTLLAVLNAAAHEGDAALARMAWNLLVGTLLSPSIAANGTASVCA